MQKSSIAERSSRDMLEKSFAEKCWRRVLEVGQECCAEMSEKSVVETCSERRVLSAREVLKKIESDVGDASRRDVLYRSVGDAEESAL